MKKPGIPLFISFRWLDRILGGTVALLRTPNETGEFFTMFVVVFNNYLVQLTKNEFWDSQVHSDLLLPVNILRKIFRLFCEADFACHTLNTHIQTDRNFHLLVLADPPEVVWASRFIQTNRE